MPRAKACGSESGSAATKPGRFPSAWVSTSAAARSGSSPAESSPSRDSGSNPNCAATALRESPICPPPGSGAARESSSSACRATCESAAVTKARGACAGRSSSADRAAGGPPQRPQEASAAAASRRAPRWARRILRAAESAMVRGSGLRLPLHARFLPKRLVAGGGVARRACVEAHLALELLEQLGGADLLRLLLALHPLRVDVAPGHVHARLVDRGLLRDLVQHLVVRGVCAGHLEAL